MIEYDKAVSNIDIKEINRMNLINILFKNNGITQQQIAESLNMSMPTVIQYLKEFRKKNLLIEEKSMESSGGRRPKLIEFNYNSHYSVGVRLQYKKHFIIIVNMKGELKGTFQYERIFEHTNEFWEQLSNEIYKALELYKIEYDKVIGIGMALPCSIVKDEKRFLKSTLFSALENVPFEEIQKHFKYPIHFEKEANAAGYAEIWARHKYNDAIFLSINQEVGGALITNNGISYGNNGRLGEFGHIVIRIDGKKCVCGRKGCFEAYCSTRVLSETSNGEVNIFLQKLNDKRPEAIKLFEEYLYNLATMIVNIRISMDCDIVIGGEITKVLANRMDKLEAILNEEDKYQEKPDYLSLAYYGETGGAIGAAVLNNVEFFNG